jgi:hypothetical protein
VKTFLIELAAFFLELPSAHIEGLVQWFVILVASQTLYRPFSSVVFGSVSILVVGQPAIGWLNWSQFAVDFRE